MSPASVKILPGFASHTIGNETYGSDWALHVRLPGDTNSARYEVSILTQGGEAASAHGMLAKWNWESDPNALLYLDKSEIIDNKIVEGQISVEEAERIRDVLTAVQRREQEVININDESVPDFRKDPIISFLQPRIVIAAQNVREDRTVRVWDIDEKLREEREGREEPPPPVS